MKWSGPVGVEHRSCQMEWRRALVVCLGLGLLVSSTGLAMCWFGGWGPCGPGSKPARIGELLTISQALYFMEACPPLDSTADWLFHRASGAASVVTIVVLFWLTPAMNWALLFFLGGWGVALFRARCCSGRPASRARRLGQLQQRRTAACPRLVLRPCRSGTNVRRAAGRGPPGAT